MGIRKNFVVPGGLTVDSSTLYVDDPNNRVGVGKTNPDHALDVSGVIKASNGVVTLTTSGTPTETLPDGAIAIDTTNAKLFFRSSSTWNEVTAGGGGGGGSLTVATTAPSSPSEGDLWYESDTGVTFVYYDSFWVEIGPSVIDSLSTLVTTKGDILVASAGNDLDRLGVGANGYVLTADSSASVGVSWKISPVNDIITAKGDLIVGASVDNAGIVNVGANDALLVADSSAGQGVKWTISPQNLELTRSLFVSLKEKWSISATAATGTINLDCLNSGAFYLTSNASANWTFNFRGTSEVTLNSILNVNESLTVAAAITNGSTAYYATGFQIDGSAVTPKWLGNLPPTVGNTSSIDVYFFTIIKTSSSPAYAVLASLAFYK
jgi:hypothetical protein